MVARETDRAQIVVYGVDGAVAERRDFGKGTILPEHATRTGTPA